MKKSRWKSCSKELVRNGSALGPKSISVMKFAEVLGGTPLSRGKELSSECQNAAKYLDRNNISSNLDDTIKNTHTGIEHDKTKSNSSVRKKEKFRLLKENPFLGNIYILTSGETYSGGAEFSSLMRQHTNAMFIGEEVGGSFYGNTSGYELELTLPNTKIIAYIPILKFVLEVDKGKFGQGVLPDYNVQPTINEYLNGIDKEMEFAINLISQ